MSKNIFTRMMKLSAIVLLALSMQAPFLATAGAISNGTIISLMNAERTAQGLSAYTYNSALASSASAKAQHMCTYDYWAHTAPDGTTAWHFMSAAGYAYTAAGENLAKGFSTDSGVVQGWMNSAGHRANILSSKYSETGVGSASCDDTVIVVAHYGARAQAPAPAPKPAPVTKAANTPSVAQTVTTRSEEPAAPAAVPALTPSEKPAEEIAPEQKNPTLELLLELLQQSLRSQ